MFLYFPLKTSRENRIIGRGDDFLTSVLKIFWLYKHRRSLHRYGKHLLWFKVLPPVSYFLFYSWIQKGVLFLGLKIIIDSPRKSPNLTINLVVEVHVLVRCSDHGRRNVQIKPRNQYITLSSLFRHSNPVVIIVNVFFSWVRRFYH